MMSDTNSLISFIGNSMVSLIGGEGNLIFIGILAFICLTVILLLSRVRASAAVMIGAAFAVMLSFIEPAFGFLFWIAMLIAAIVLVNGLRKQFTGQ